MTSVCTIVVVIHETMAIELCLIVCLNDKADA